MVWISLDPAVENFVKLLMFCKRSNGKCRSWYQLKMAVYERYIFLDIVREIQYHRIA